MSSWFYGLQFRLVVGFTLVLALALGSVSLYAGRVAGDEAGAFERRRDEVGAARIQQMVSGFYADRRAPAELQDLLKQASRLSGRRIIVKDLQGRIVGDSQPMFGVPRRMHDRGTMMAAPILIGEEAVGSFEVAREDIPEIIREPPVSRLVSNLNRSLLWTGLAAAAGGIMMVSLLSRRVLAPVRGLSAAAQRLGRGDLSQRVPVSGHDEISQLAQTFNAMASNLQRAEEQRRNLVADIAHELRTPLSNVQGYLEAVKDGLLQPDAATLDTIHQQVLHLGRLVEDLRLLALAEAGALKLDVGPGSLQDLLHRSVEGFRARAEAKGIVLSLHVPDYFPLVRMDRTRAAQIVGNLLENAIQHTPETGRVGVTAEVAGAGTARVTVADTGRGIPPEELPLVFERLYRVDPSRTRTTGGAGLGLTIAKQLVELQGGTIRAESTPGQGSRFIFELPLAS